ncbi:hypothetical protein [Pseudomonas sp. NPDC089734]|uniref:hypothetical protein n=1 Tax=Pseudomonas sp. NPDC089734 TaxID=3364469 RepID=UPI0037FD8FFB
MPAGSFTALNILQDEAAAEVFILALDGLLADQPSPDLLMQRVQLLSERFVIRD